MRQHAYLLKIIQNYFKEFFLVLHTNPAGTYLEIQAELCPSARFEDIYHLIINQSSLYTVNYVK